VHIWLTSHPVLATITIGSGTLISSQIIWGAIKHVQNRIKNSRGEVNEVMIFNELSECCSVKLVKNQSSGPCENNFCIIRNIQNVIKYIDEAKYCIDFAMLTFTIKDILNALIRANERGVRIRVITDNEMIESSGGKMLILKNFAVDVRAPKYNSPVMHHKFMLIDGQNAVNEIFRQKPGKLRPGPYRSLILNGTVNWTLQGFGGNFENCMISSDKIMTTKLEAEFDRMWTVFKSI